jgi:hypothetical protein
VPRTLLLVYAIAFTALIGAPLVLAPLAWARTLGWRVPEPTELAIYFGRCLGAVVIAIAAEAIWVSGDPASVGRMLDLIALALGAMTAVHAWGWIRGVQPRFEDLETFGYAALLALTIWVRTRS